MIEGLPAYLPIVFIITTFLTVGFLFYAIRQAGRDSTPAAIHVAAVSFWLFFTGSAAIYGFYTDVSGFPPRIFLLGALPAILFIAADFIFFRKGFVDRLPLRTLTLLSIVRIPVEIVIYGLYTNGQMPRAMTFAGWNFDIFAGISAPFIAWLAFRGGRINRHLLIGWNAAALGLLGIVVATAILSLPTAFQQFGIGQPNRAVLYFPFIWLPTIVVPIVFCSHLTALWQLTAGRQPAS